jgi:hypothetical protein
MFGVPKDITEKLTGVLKRLPDVEGICVPDFTKTLMRQYYDMGFDILFDNKALDNLFDLLRMYGVRNDGENLTRITQPHILEAINLAKNVKNPKEKFNKFLEVLAQLNYDANSQIVQHMVLALRTLLHLSKRRHDALQEMEIDVIEILRNTMDFDGIILGICKPYRFSGKESVNITLFDESHGDTFGNMNICSDNFYKYCIYKIYEIIGWEEFLDKVGTKNVWNGEKLHVCSVDLMEDKGLDIKVQKSSYVSHLGTNYGILPNTEKWISIFSEHEKIKDEIEKISEKVAIVKKGIIKGRFNDDDEKTVRAQLDYFIEIDYFKNIHDFSYEELGKKIREQIKKERDEPHELKESLMANLLSVNVTFVTEDEKYVLIQKRGQEVGHGYVPYQTSVAGFVDYEDIKKDDPCKATIAHIATSLFREAEEESGIRQEDILDYKILGVVRDTTNFEVGLMIFGILKNAKCISIENGKTTKDASGIAYPALEYGGEVDGFFLVPFTSDSVFDFILSQKAYPDGDPWANFMPLGAASIIFALAHKRSWKEIQQVWREKVKHYVRNENRRFTPKCYGGMIPAWLQN